MSRQEVMDKVSFSFKARISHRRQMLANIYICICVCVCTCVLFCAICSSESEYCATTVRLMVFKPTRDDCHNSGNV